MEVLVSELPGAPKDAVVSLRLGSVCRQAKLHNALEHSFRFPCSRNMSWPLRIEVLQPVCSARVVIHPSQSKYIMDFEGSGIAVGLDVRQTPEESPKPRPPSSAKDTASSAKEYFEVHGVLQYVQAMLHAMIQERPDDPYAFMLRQLSSSRAPRAEALAAPAAGQAARSEEPQAAGAPADAEERPATRRRPAPSGELFDPESMRIEVQSLLRSAAESGSLRDALKAVEAEMLARGGTQALAGLAGDGDRSETARPTPPAATADDGSAQPKKKTSVKGAKALMSGIRSGEVGRIIDISEAMESEPTVAAREEPTLACLPAAEPAADPPKGRKPGTEGVRMELQGALIAAAETGELATVLREANSQPADPAANPAVGLPEEEKIGMEGVRMELQGALFAAVEAGDLTTVLREATSQPADPFVKPSACPPEEEKLGMEGVRMELQGALFAAAEAGELTTVLQEATSQPDDPAAKRTVDPPEDEKLGSKVPQEATSHAADPGMPPLIQS